MHRVLYSGFSAQTLNQIHFDLKQQINLTPCYALTSKTKELSQDFDDAIKHEIFDSRNGIFPSEISLNLSEPTTDAAEAFFKTFKNRALAMMGRQSESGWEFSFSEREHFFEILTCYWSKALRNIPVDFAISRNVPHFASEYILAKICELKKIPFIQYESIWALKRSYFFRDFESRCPSVEYDTLSEMDAYTTINTILNQNSGQYSAAKPDYLVEKEKQEIRAKAPTYLAKDAMRLPLHFLRDVYRSTIRKKVITEVNIKKNQSPINKLESMQTPFSLAVHKRNARKLIDKNKKIYGSMVKSSTVNEPYILFAPNYQPERTTMPDGGEFYDMLKVLRILSSALPSGWKIVYKEHPTIFRWPSNVFLRGHLFRNQEFYNTLSLFESVVCVGAHSNTFELVDKSEAVCSVTGTICFQASVRGIKSVVFGSTWFDDCDLVHKFTDISELRSFLLSNNYPIRNPVDAWQEYLNRCWSRSFPTDDLLNPKSNKKQYVQHLVKFLEFHNMAEKVRENK